MTTRATGALTLDRTTIERRVVEVSGELAAALHRGAPLPPVSLESHLEADLGIYSLERVRLTLSLEEAFGFPLADGAVTTAERVGDIADAISGRAVPRRDRTVPHPRVCGGSADNDRPPRSLAFTACVAMLLAAMAPPVWLLLVLCGDQRRATALLRRAARALLRAARCPLEVRGIEHLRQRSPVVLAANHESFIDSLVLVAALPLHFKIVVNERLPRAPLIGTAIRRAGYVVVNRATTKTRLAGTAAMLAALHRGESLLVFPEGTTAQTPQLLPFRLGAFSAAVEAGRPIVPIALSGTRNVLPRGTWVLARAPLRVVIQPAIDPSGADWSETLRLRDRVRVLIDDVRNETRSHDNRRTR
jgi:1-acyl-sn-glycerol-3-phosphate acyltransferase